MLKPTNRRFIYALVENASLTAGFTALVQAKVHIINDTVFRYCGVVRDQLLGGLRRII